MLHRIDQFTYLVEGEALIYLGFYYGFKAGRKGRILVKPHRSGVLLWILVLLEKDRYPVVDLCEILGPRIHGEHHEMVVLIS